MALTGCGEMWDFEVKEPVAPASLTLPRRVLTIVEGDSYTVPVGFTVQGDLQSPPTVPTVYWQSADETIALFTAGTLHAVGEGIAKAVVRSAVGSLKDSCVVCVLPPFQVANSDFAYDMVVYASVDIHGTPLTTANADDYVIGAYVGDHLRGIGRVLQSHGRQYLELRVWSPFPSGETVTVRCYFRGQARMELFADSIAFDGAMHGTLSQLYPLVLDEQAREYVPNLDSIDYNPIIDEGDTIRIVIQ